MPEIAPQEAQKPTPTSDNEIGTQAGKQGLQPKLVQSGVNRAWYIIKRVNGP